MKRLVWIFSLLFVVCGVSAQQVEYYHLDGIGSVRAISDANGNEIARHDYLPFGEEWNPTPSPDRLRFAGKERDTETGLDYLGARYLGNDDGRFRSVDPVMAIASNINDPQQWNRYSYARNNPTAYVDPDGRILESAWDAVSLGAGLLSLKSNLQAGNYWSAALDTVGVVADGAALLLPGVPGGAGAGIKAVRGADKGVDLVRGGNRATDFAGGGDTAGLAIASTSGASAQMQVVRRIDKGEKIADIVNGGKGLTFTTGNEHALVKLANGDRALVSGGPGGITFAEGQVTRIFGHSHPTSAPPSAADFASLRRLGQSQQTVFHGGQVTKIRP